MENFLQHPNYQHVTDDEKGNIGKLIKKLQENVSNIKFYISFLSKKLLIIQEIE